MEDGSTPPVVPTITSFILRFVLDESASAGQSTFRGAIRHIQTDEEITFTRWEDAVTFINRFVPLETETKEK